MSRIAAPSLTAVAALLALQGSVVLAQDAATDEATPEAATEAPADDAMADNGMATDGMATDDDMATDDAMSGEAMAPDATADDGMDAAMSEEMAPGDVSADPAAMTPNPDMQAVLDKAVELGIPAIGTVSVEEQRAAPTLADAVMAVMEDRGIAPDPMLEGIATREVTYPDAGGGEQPIRVYTPEGEGPFPLIVYFHGGGWVLADLDTYDASARALAAGTGAVVASVEYRHAPENMFPAAHDDANAAYAWLIENSGSLNADAERVAVAGESAGANLAMNVAINARDLELTQPDHMLLVYPVAGDDMETPSYQAYASAMPLSKPAMMWFVEHVFADPTQATDPRLDLVARADLAGLPPATVINAEIDPLQSEGEVLAANLAAAGVQVTQMTYPSVTHEFFGMGAVVPTAKEAMAMATNALKRALASAQ